MPRNPADAAARRRSPKGVSLGNVPEQRTRSAGPRGAAIRTGGAPRSPAASVEPYRETDTMHAWAVDTPGPIDGHPLRRVERPTPETGPGQVRVHVRACGVCRTDLHLAEGDLPPTRPLVIPGHEVVGTV